MPKATTATSGTCVACASTTVVTTGGNKDVPAQIHCGKCGLLVTIASTT